MVQKCDISAISCVQPYILSQNKKDYHMLTFTSSYLNIPKDLCFITFSLYIKKEKRWEFAFFIN